MPLGSGLTPEVVSWAIGNVADGRWERPAGRRGRASLAWVNGLVQFGDTKADARALLGDRVLPRIHHNFRSHAHAVAPEHAAEIERFRRRYDARDRRPATLARNLALVGDYAYERFSICGPPDECRDRIASVAAAGADGFIMATQRRDREARLRQVVEFGRHVIAPTHTTATGALRAT